MPYKNREDRLARNHAYYGANKEAAKVAAKRYREANKGRIKIQRKKHYEENKLEISERKKRYYHINKEKVKDKMSEYRASNRESLRESARLYAITHKDQRAKYVADNKEKLAGKCREYRKNNLGRICVREKAHRATNIVRIKAREAAYRVANSDKLKQYYEGHKTSILERQKKSQKRRRHADPAYNLRRRISCRLWAMLRHKAWRRTEDLLGYTMQELKTHIERQFTPGMTWEKLLAGEIHIDHIIPVSSFSITDVDDPDFKKCWGLQNLQPLWAKDNISKSNKPHEEWLRTKG